uniref:Uncharacterized protein n=1 Tax=Leersia perrieri TaxID=77586 RepID=A0A0D9WZ76_9ORYZ
MATVKQPHVQCWPLNNRRHPHSPVPRSTPVGGRRAPAGGRLRGRAPGRQGGGHAAAQIRDGATAELPGGAAAQIRDDKAVGSRRRSSRTTRRRSRDGGGAAPISGRVTKRTEDPPSSTAFLHAAFTSAAFSLAFLPSSDSPPINDLTARSSSAASTKLFLFLSTSIATATPRAATIMNAFSGHGTIGTPNHRLSSVEFHPPCFGFFLSITGNGSDDGGTGGNPGMSTSPFWKKLELIEAPPKRPFVRLLLNHENVVVYENPPSRPPGMAEETWTLILQLDGATLEHESVQREMDKVIQDLTCYIHVVD